MLPFLLLLIFFFNDTPPTDIYTLSLHDALPIWLRKLAAFAPEAKKVAKTLADYGIRFVIVEPLPSTKMDGAAFWIGGEDRKSTRLNSSHTVISYAVFCLKKKKNNKLQKLIMMSI